MKYNIEIQNALKQTASVLSIEKEYIVSRYFGGLTLNKFKEALRWGDLSKKSTREILNLFEGLVDGTITKKKVSKQSLTELNDYYTQYRKRKKVRYAESLAKKEAQDSCESKCDDSKEITQGSPLNGKLKIRRIEGQAGFIGFHPTAPNNDVLYIRADLIQQVGSFRTEERGSFAGVWSSQGFIAVYDEVSAIFEALEDALNGSMPELLDTQVEDAPEKVENSNLDEHVEDDIEDTEAVSSEKNAEADSEEGDEEDKVVKGLIKKVRAAIELCLSHTEDDMVEVAEVCAVMGNKIRVNDLRNVIQTKRELYAEYTIEKCLTDIERKDGNGTYRGYIFYVKRR